MSIYT